MAEATLDAMAFGGIRDHLGGGFHRYSTDAEWLVPHFEKMLTDNAQLLGVYARAYAITGDETYARVARSTGDYLLREMRGDGRRLLRGDGRGLGGRRRKIFCLGPERNPGDARRRKKENISANGMGFGRAATSARKRRGAAPALSILHLSKKISSLPGAKHGSRRLRARAPRRAREAHPSLPRRQARRGLERARRLGPRVAGRILTEPRYLDAARLGARFLLEDCRDASGRLQRTWKDGVAKIPSFLEDEAFLAHALLDLEEADDEGGPGAWRGEAVAAVASMRARFRRKDGPGFAFSGDGNEALLVNGRDLFDKATPSASGAAAWALARLALEDRRPRARARGPRRRRGGVVAHGALAARHGVVVLRATRHSSSSRANTVRSLSRTPAERDDLQWGWARVIFLRR